MNTHACSVFGTKVCQPFLSASPSPAATALATLATPATGNGAGACMVGLWCHSLQRTQNMRVCLPCPAAVVALVARRVDGYGTASRSEARVWSDGRVIVGAMD